MRLKSNLYIFACLLVMFIGISLTQAVSDNIDIGLTPQEKAFLNGKTIRIGVDSARPPFEYIDEKGVYSGISAEIIQTCAKRLGVTIVPTSGLTIKEAIDKVKTGEIDVIPKITPTPEREKYLLFTNVYATFPSVIVARKDMRFIGGLDDLYGLKVGVLKGLIVADLLKRDYPKMQLISLPDIRSALLDLSVEKIDVFVDNLGTVSYNIDKLGLTNLKIAAPTPYNHDLAIGVKKDLPLLVSAMNKVLLGMSSQEKTMIKNHWLSIEYKQGTNWKIIAPIALSFFVIIVFILIWNRRLSLVVSQREKVQQELKNYALELQSNSAIKLQVSQIASELQKTMTFSEISLKFLSMTVPLLNASYGMLYIYDKSDKLLKSTGGYGALVTDKSFALGQGLVGQCALSQSPIVLNNLSNSEITVNWGVGEAYPQTIILTRVMQNDELLGVLELAALIDFQIEYQELLNDLLPILSLNIEILKRNLNTKILLNQTQELAVKFQTQQQLLKETEVWYQNIIESAPDGILVVNKAGEIILANSMSENIFGYEHSELIGKNVDILVPKNVLDHNHKRDSFFNNIKKTRPIGDEINRSGVKKDGIEFPVEVGLSMLFENELRERCVCVSVRDISIRREVEQEIRQHTKDLERFSMLTIDREERMIELKEEVNNLLEKMNKGKKYKIVT